MFRSITDLISGETTWVRDAAHWQSMNAQNVPPADESQPYRCWVVASTAPISPFWWFTPPPPTGARVFNILNRDPVTGRLLTYAPDDPYLMMVYQGSALAAIREYPFFWGDAGVPAPVAIELALKDVQAYNFPKRRQPSIDYPINLRTDALLVPGDLACIHGAVGNEDCYWIEINEWINMNLDPLNAMSDEQRVAQIHAMSDPKDLTANPIKLSKIRAMATKRAINQIGV